MTNKRSSSLLTTRQMATVAILAAIAAVLFMIEIPVVLFYKLDLSSLPVLLGTFAMGPVPGTLILLVKALLKYLNSGKVTPETVTIRKSLGEARCQAAEGLYHGRV